MTAYQLKKAVHNKELSPTEILAATKKRWEEVEELVQSFITLTPELAEEDLKSKRGGVLTGIPVALKDNMSTEGVLTSCASRILENYYPPYDATVVELLSEAGALMVGKTNLDEFAMGSSTENSYYHTTRNPWDLERVPGGSSGGSAACVAAGEAAIAIGSDTGGSIRQPAAFCGVVGVKPTYGLVSRYGLLAFASSLDQIGTLTRDVRDAALAMNVISGHDPLDSTSLQQEIPDYMEGLEDGVEGLRIGVPREYFLDDMQAEVKEAVRSAVERLEEMGARAEEVSLPHTEYALPAYYLVAPAEASSNLARFDGVQYGYRSLEADNLLDLYLKTRQEGFGDEVKRRIMLGTYALSSGYYDAYYLKALKVRRLIKEDFEAVFKDYDLLIAPTTPSTAFRVGEKTEDLMAMYLSDICTVPINMAGLPAISIPCGYDQKGMPIGMQLIGDALTEKRLLRAAYSWEQAFTEARKWPEPGAEKEVEK